MARLRPENMQVPYGNGARRHAGGRPVSSQRDRPSAGQGRELEPCGLRAIDRIEGKSVLSHKELPDRRDERRLQSFVLLRDACRPRHSGLFLLRKDQEKGKTGGAFAPCNNLDGVFLEAAVLYFLPVHAQHQLLVQVRIPGKLCAAVSGCLLGGIPPKERRISRQEELVGHSPSGCVMSGLGACFTENMAGGRKRQQLDRAHDDHGDNMLIGIPLCAGRRPGASGQTKGNKEKPEDPGRGTCDLRIVGSFSRDPRDPKDLPHGHGGRICLVQPGGAGADQGAARR